MKTITLREGGAAYRQAIHLWGPDHLTGKIALSIEQDGHSEPVSLSTTQQRELIRALQALNEKAEKGAT